MAFIPVKPGTMIDPGFVSYTGTVPEAISMESMEKAIISNYLHSFSLDSCSPLDPTAISLPSFTEMHSAVGFAASTV